MCESFGARVTSSVSGKTDLLIVGKEPGASKVGKARDSAKCQLVTLADLTLSIQGEQRLEAATDATEQIESFSAGYQTQGMLRMGGGAAARRPLKPATAPKAPPKAAKKKAPKKQQATAKAAKPKAAPKPKAKAKAKAKKSPAAEKRSSGRKKGAAATKAATAAKTKKATAAAGKMTAPGRKKSRAAAAAAAKASTGDGEA